MRNPVCSPNTTVKVRGKMQCDNFTSYSNYAVLNINRAGLPTSISGPEEIPQGVNSLQQYSIPEINCALDPSQYVWSLPNNWSGQTQGRNIQITPASCTGGNISLTVSCTGGGSFTLSKTISRPPFSTFPSISGDNFICDSPKTYSLTNIPINSSSITWSEVIFSNPAKFQFQGGTQGNSVILANNYNGNGVLKATISNPCGASTSTQTNIRVGTYTQSEMQPITGPTSPCMGVQSTYYSPYLSANNADYDWQISSSWQFSTYKDASAFYVTPYYQTFAQISLKVRNACGWPSIPALLSINTANCGSYRYGAGPNPVKGKLTVTASWEAKQAGTTVFKGASKLPDYTAKLYDEKGALYYEGTTDTPTVEIDMRTYPKGVYYLHLGSGNTWEKRRVVKE
jgi:large repetitive protein